MHSSTERSRKARARLSSGKVLVQVEVPPEAISKFLDLGYIEPEQLRDREALAHSVSWLIELFANGHRS